jgi:hypothetical protein
MKNRCGFEVNDVGRECARCKQFKLWKEYYKKSREKTGYDSSCKDCDRVSSGSVKREKYKINDIGRQCTCCKEFKPWGEFYNQKNGINGHNSSCKNCIRKRLGYQKQKKRYIAENGRECSVCGEFKAWCEFNKSSSSPNGHVPLCKSCSRAKGLHSRHKITDKEYFEMQQDQNGTCAICGKKESAVTSYGEIKPLAVDHCHETGKIRGLLCDGCNRALGFFKDSVSNLESAIEYLKKHNI